MGSRVYEGGRFIITQIEIIRQPLFSHFPTICGVQIKPDLAFWARAIKRAALRFERCFEIGQRFLCQENNKFVFGQGSGVRRVEA